jgi:uncharacterized damage-inducible protein DinB
MFVQGAEPMLHSIDAFLAYFDGVHRRALRDVGLLPPHADGWTPAYGEGEQSWSINTLVGHMAGARLYFASAYLAEGWRIAPPPDVSRRERWLPALEESAAEFRQRLEGTPDAWLQRKVSLIDSPQSISGWRILLMMVEHEVHHRSQINTYAGLNGWPVPDIFGRKWEQIEALQARDE